MTSLERKEAIAASPKTLRSTERNRKIIAPIMRAYMRLTRFRLFDEGRQHVPRDGPALILSNHVGFFDPMTVIFAARRNIHFLTTQATMTDPGLARVMRLFGAVPKQKGAADPKAIRGLQAWAKVGGTVGLFPEGERSWDGRQLPFLPGIERLVRMLRVPVITARIENADFVTPRWAESKRSGDLRVTLDAPRSFEKNANKDEIRAWLEDRLRVDPGNCWRSPVQGARLARGLSNLIYMCPRCANVESLVESDNAVNCRACGVELSIDAHNLLKGPGSGPNALWEVAPDIDRQLGEQIDAKLSEDPAADLLVSDEIVEAFAWGDEVKSLGLGQLSIGAHRIALLDDDGHSVWEAPMETVAAMTIELIRRLQIFLKSGQLIELRVPRESVIKYKRAFDHLRGLADERAAIAKAEAKAAKALTKAHA